MSNMILTKPAIRKLRRVKKLILKEPQRVYMGDWIHKPGLIEGLDVELNPKCGTVACIAGWIVAASLPRPKDVYLMYSLSIPHDAAELLDTTKTSLDSLFYVACWPYELQTALSKHIPGKPGYAKVVAKRIDSFIEDHSE